MITTRLSVPRPPRVAPLILFIIGLSLAARITSPHNILNGKLAEEGEEGNFDQKPGHCLAAINYLCFNDFKNRSVFWTIIEALI